MGASRHVAITRLLVVPAMLVAGCGPLNVIESSGLQEPAFPSSDVVGFEPGWEVVSTASHGPGGDEVRELALVRGGTYGQVGFACDGNGTMTIVVRDASAAPGDDSQVASVSAECRSTVVHFDFPGPDHDAALMLDVTADGASRYWALLAVPGDRVASD